MPKECRLLHKRPQTNVGMHSPVLTCCVENACENTSPDDKLKEFSYTAKNNPGTNYHMERVEIKPLWCCHTTAPTPVIYVQGNRDGNLHGETSPQRPTSNAQRSTGGTKEVIKTSPLPQISKNFMILAYNGQAYAKANAGSTLQLHLVAENMEITTRLSNSTCEIETGCLVGCYDCVAEAELSLYCRSTEGEIIADIKCPTQDQVALCTTNSHLNKIIFHFGTSTISTECIALCPGGTAKFTVKGMLQFVNDGYRFQSDTKPQKSVRIIPKNISHRTVALILTVFIIVLGIYRAICYDFSNVSHSKKLS
ncbi:hypothetical protein RB195_011829 [Necator americanus]|uniref:Phlebovirus glycoprotein G2 fusion domain-containing protein n=1 Tax=Necator americanus TaxID=51031 RepID=A0ABR1D591_NECAM